MIETGGVMISGLTPAPMGNANASGHVGSAMSYAIDDNCVIIGGIRLERAKGD